MTYQFNELDKSHGEQMLQLAKETNTGSDLFYVDRTPDFFRLSETFGKTRHFGLFNEDSLIGSVAVSQQKRVIEGKCQLVYYLNDLRVHPDYHRTFAYYRLIEHLLTLYRNEGTVKWMFSTVLDSNTNKISLSKGYRLIPNGVEIGKTVHIGVPMFMKSRKNSSVVSEIDGERAWEIYKKMAKFQSFSPCEKKIFLEKNGLFFVLKNEKNDDLSICKLVNQSDARKLRLSKKLPISFKIVNALCRIAGCPPLPNPGEEFQHGYMAFFATRESPKRSRDEFITYIQRTYKHNFSYLFFGTSVAEASHYQGRPFHIRLSSTTFAYGDIPENLSMNYHELILI